MPLELWAFSPFRNQLGSRFRLAVYARHSIVEIRSRVLWLKLKPTSQAETKRWVDPSRSVLQRFWVFRPICLFLRNTLFKLESCHLQQSEPHPRCIKQRPIGFWAKCRTLSTHLHKSGLVSIVEFKMIKTLFLALPRFGAVGSSPDLLTESVAMDPKTAVKNVRRNSSHRDLPRKMSGSNRMQRWNFFSDAPKIPDCVKTIVPMQVKQFRRSNKSSITLTTTVFVSSWRERLSGQVASKPRFRGTKLWCENICPIPI